MHSVCYTISYVCIRVQKFENLKTTFLMIAFQIYCSRCIKYRNPESHHLSKLTAKDIVHILCQSLLWDDESRIHKWESMSMVSNIYVKITLISISSRKRFMWQTAAYHGKLVYWRTELWPNISGKVIFTALYNNAIGF